MIAEVKGLHSPDVDDLSSFHPNGPFGLLIQASIGPLGEDGAETFDIFVCSPSWLDAHLEDRIEPGRHKLLMRRFDLLRLRDFLAGEVARVSGGDWPEVAFRLSRLGQWEFEDYQPAGAAA